MSEDFDIERPERIRSLAADISSELASAQRQRAQEAQELGYASSLLRDLSNRMEGVKDDPAFGDIERSMGKFRMLVHEKEKARSEHHYGVVPFATVLTSTAAATTLTSTALLKDFDFERWKSAGGIGGVLAPWSRERIEVYAQTLTTVSPNLGPLCVGAWENFHSGSVESARAALAIMRELITQFLHVIAPDDEVRKSPYFTPKGDPIPDQVHRRERILYAANTKVADDMDRTLLLSEADLLLSTFGRLNRLHAHEELELVAVQETLKAAQGFVEHWIDALYPRTFRLS